MTYSFDSWDVYTFSGTNLASVALSYDTFLQGFVKHQPYLPLLSSRTASSPIGWYSLRLLMARLSWSGCSYKLISFE